MTIPLGPNPRTGAARSPDGAVPGQADGAARALEELGRSWTWILASAIATLVPGGLAGLLMAVLYVLAGVLCLRNPLQTISALSLVVGVVWLVSGILTLYTAITAEDLPHRAFVLGAAVIGIVAGIVVLALPAESARALTRLLGLWLVLLGLFELVLALAWRAALRRSGITDRHETADA